MDPNRFVIGERVRYQNHVTGEEIGLLEVVGLDADFVLCSHFFSRRKHMKFHRDGRATWSCNLSICHEDKTNPHAELSRAPKSSAGERICARHE